MSSLFHLPCCFSNKILIFFSILKGWLSNYNQYKIINKTSHSEPTNDNIELF